MTLHSTKGSLLVESRRSGASAYWPIAACREGRQSTQSGRERLAYCDDHYGMEIKVQSHREIG